MQSIFNTRYAYSFHSWLHMRIKFAIKLERKGDTEKMNAFTLPTGRKSVWGGLRKFCSYVALY